MFKAVYSKTNPPTPVVVLTFLGTDVGLVRCVCVTESGHPVIASTLELRFDVTEFAKMFLEVKPEVPADDPVDLKPDTHEKKKVEGKNDQRR